MQFSWREARDYTYRACTSRDRIIQPSGGAAVFRYTRSISLAVGRNNRFNRR